MQGFRNKKISIITVVYNNAAELERTILSVVQQTYQDKEYIIIDGGSVDGTIEILKKYSNRINKWISESDEGIYSAMNKGLELATGDWVIFMNAGDIFQDSKAIELVFSERISENIEFLYSDFFVKKQSGDVVPYRASFEKGFLLHQSIIYKKRLHENIGHYITSRKTIVADYLFFNAISPDRVQKVNTPISINSESGFSAAEWCALQKLCVDYIYGRISFKKMLFLAFIYKIKSAIIKVLPKKRYYSKLKMFVEYKNAEP